jgi:hypothetical protein
VFKCIKFFSFRKNALNDATINYVEILEKSFKELGFDFIYCKSLSEINNGDILLTIEVKDLFLLSLYKRNLKFINWYQGIVPEEAILMKKSWIRKIYLDFFEKTALKKCILNIFVSDAMKKHYDTKYKISINNYFIMPCFNKQINEKSFTNKYKNPSFVYAGSMHEWQCIDRMLEIYSNIKNQLKNASLTILTNEIEQAKLKLKKYTLDGDVKYVTLHELDNELSKYKYGFLVRDNIAVNQVATPTKLNTYMANGVIPIFSNVIDYYNNLETNYKIVLSNDDQDYMRIINFEKNIMVDNKEIYEEYLLVFQNEFNETKYINSLKSKLELIL